MPYRSLMYKSGIRNFPSIADCADAIAGIHVLMAADVHARFPGVLQVVTADEVQRLLVQVGSGGAFPGEQWGRHQPTTGCSSIDDRRIRGAQQRDRVGADAGLGGFVVRCVTTAATVGTVQHRVSTVQAAGLLVGFLRDGAHEGTDARRADQHAPVLGCKKRKRFLV